MLLSERILVLWTLSILNLELTEGSPSKEGVNQTRANKQKRKFRNSTKLTFKSVDPEEAFGFLSLNNTYNKYESPDKNETRVAVMMEPTFVIEIDSLSWR